MEMMRKALTIIGLGLTVATAMGQSLTGEIDVERSVEPQEREVSRMWFSPELRLPELPPLTLRASRVGIPVEITPEAMFLEPPMPRFGGRPGERGFLAVGLFPGVLNADVSGAYRAVKSEDITLDAWVQYDGDVYRRTVGEARRYYRNHHASVGLNLGMRTARRGLVTISGAYEIGRFNIHGVESYEWNTTNRVDLGAEWSTAENAGDVLQWKTELRYGYMGNNNGGVKQQRLLARAVPSIEVGVGQRVSLTVGADMAFGTSGQGVIELTPAYEVRRGDWSLTAGPKINMTVSGGKFLHIAPAVRGGWTPRRLPVAVELGLGGGEQLNWIGTFAGLFERLDPGRTFEVNNVPLSVDGRIAVGPFRGWTVSLSGEWARANNNWMPVVDERTVTHLERRDMQGGIVDVSVCGEIGRVAELRVGYCGMSRGYYRNYDGVRHCVEAQVAVMPLRGLRVDADFSLRLDRRLGETDMGDAAVLSVGAGYDVASRLNVFVRGMNLLNSRFTQVDNTPSRGVTGLVGVLVRI